MTKKSDQKKKSHLEGREKEDREGGEEEEAEGGEGGPVGEGGGFRAEPLVSFNPLETWRQRDLTAVLPFDL